jgi:hypothetical protein
MLVPCGKWRCEKCCKAKIEAIWEHLDSVTVPEAPLFDLHAPKRLVGAVRKAASRRKAAYLGISLHSEGLYLVAAEGLSGRGWATTQHDWEDFMAELPARLAVLEPTRTTWVGAWKREESPKSGGGMLFRGVARSVAELRAAVEEAGLDLSEPFVDGDLLKVAERLQVAFGQPPPPPKKPPRQRARLPS